MRVPFSPAISAAAASSCKAVCSTSHFHLVLQAAHRRLQTAHRRLQTADQIARLTADMTDMKQKMGGLQTAHRRLQTAHLLLHIGHVRGQAGNLVGGLQAQAGTVVSLGTINEPWPPDLCTRFPLSHTHSVSVQCPWLSAASRAEWEWSGSGT